MENPKVSNIMSEDEVLESEVPEDQSHRGDYTDEDEDLEQAP